jgi:hypothetical protein
MLIMIDDYVQIVNFSSALACTSKRTRPLCIITTGFDEMSIEFVGLHLKYPLLLPILSKIMMTCRQLLLQFPNIKFRYNLSV